MGGTVRVQRVLNKSITYSGRLLNPISTHFGLSAMLCCSVPFPFSCWVGALTKTCTLCADNSTSCLGLGGNPIYLSALKQCWFFCAFLCDKDSHLGTGLCFDRQRCGGKEEGRELACWKIPRVSSQSDENILNANGRKLPRVKLISGRGCRKMHRKEEGSHFQYATVFCLLWF